MDTPKNDILDDALAAWRETSLDETLTGPARTALFSEVCALGHETSEGFVPSVTRAWRWAILGSVPVVAIATVLLVTGERSRHGVAGPQLSAAKVNGQLVFTLDNGKTDHLIYRSSDPQSFDRASAVKMARNRYTEDATGGPTLVFYRID
jgi:hypothetical protein